MLSNQGFPADTEKIYHALECVLEGESVDSLSWLHNHVAQDYLLRVDSTNVAYEQKHKSIYFKYQALIFGFYYQLLRQPLSFHLVQAEAFFHGAWGGNSTTLLTMCTQSGRCLRIDAKVSRAHVLYMLAAMYNGWPKVFDTTSTLPGLTGIVGPISVLALSHIPTTNKPNEISRIAIVDLPMVFDQKTIQTGKWLMYNEEESPFALLEHDSTNFGSITSGTPDQHEPTDMAYDVLMRQISDKTNEEDDRMVFTTEEAVPRILSDEGNTSDGLESPKMPARNVIESRKNHTLPEPIFALSLPLLVDRIMQYLPLPTSEPEVSPGKVRVHWTSVCSIQSSFDNTLTLTIAG